MSMLMSMSTARTMDITIMRNMMSIMTIMTMVIITTIIMTIVM